MNKVIKGDTLNNLTYNVMQEVLSGDVSSSRNGDVHFLNNALLELSNPRARHVSLKGRKNNIFATIAETFWVMSGMDGIDPYMSFYLPRAKEFSDNGVDWRGAYGPRIYNNNQVQGVIDIFKNEGLDTRRAVISIYDSNLDSPEALRDKYDLSNSKDIPCNNLLHFYVRDNKLNCNAFSRSGDVVWGVTNINIFEWTFLMEFIAQEIGVDVGTYSHFITNLHIYDFTKGQCEKVLQNDQPEGNNQKRLVFPVSEVVSGSDHNRLFFFNLVNEFTKLIRDSNYPIQFGIQEIFDNYNLDTINNLLYDYAMSVASFTQHKLGKESTLVLPSGDFKDAVSLSPFRKFELR